MFVPSFSENIPEKIGDGIAVAGKNTLIKTEVDDEWRVAIADEPIDTKVDGKKFFCVRVENSGANSSMMFGFTTLETFDSNNFAYFGYNGFTGCGINLYDGQLCYPVDNCHIIFDEEISKKAKEIIAILTVSNNGTKKEIRFLCDGNESQSSDVSEILEGDFLFPAICLCNKNQQITTIPIDRIKTRTPEIENLIKEYQQQNPLPLLPSVSNEINNQVISQLHQQINDDQRILIQVKDKQIQEMRKSYEEQLKHARLQLDEFRKDFLKQLQLEREISNKQLELERAENQQLRNLLQHKKDEMSSMEIYYLKRESGQRREREEETEFKVKEEPKHYEEEKPIQHNNKKNKNKTKSKK
jgi:hypothetical protein